MYLTKKAKSLQNPQLCMNFGSRNTFSFKCRGLNIIYRFKFLKKKFKLITKQMYKTLSSEGNTELSFQRTKSL